MNTRPRTGIGSRIGVAVGAISIAFSTLCCWAVGVFSGAFMLAALVGTLASVVAFALDARRTALVTFTFGFAPLLEFLVLEGRAFERILDGYGVLAIVSPLALAVVVAALAVLHYLKERTARAG